MKFLLKIFLIKKFFYLFLTNLRLNVIKWKKQSKKVEAVQLLKVIPSTLNGCEESLKILKNLEIPRLRLGMTDGGN